MKWEAYPSPFAALSFPDSKKSYPFAAGLTGTIFQPLDGWRNVGAISWIYDDFLHHNLASSHSTTAPFLVRAVQKPSVASYFKSILLCFNSAVWVYALHVYRKIDMATECISFLTESRDLLSFSIWFWQFWCSVRLETKVKRKAMIRNFYNQIPHHEVKRKKLIMINTIKSHIPPSKPKRKEAHAEFDKRSRKTCRMNSSFS